MFSFFTSFLFGLFLALAFIVGNFLLWKKAKEKDFPSDLVFDLSLISLSLGFIAGRLFYILANWQVFSVDIFRWIHLVRYPGISGKAVFLFSLLALIYFGKKKKINLYLFLDLLVVPFLYALILGQVGCFFNSCLLGAATPSFLNFLGKTHPVAVYTLILTIILLPLAKKLSDLSQRIVKLNKTHNWEILPEGLLFLLILLIYSLGNFVLEFFKDNVLYLKGVKLALVFDAILFLTSMFFLVKRIGRKNLKEIVNYAQVQISQRGAFANKTASGKETERNRTKAFGN